MRDAGHPDARLLLVQRDRVQRARRGQGAARDRGAARVPGRGQARRPGLGARDQVRRARAADVPSALVAAFSYDTRVILERHVAGRDLAVSVIDGPDGPEALPLVEAIPVDEDFYDFEARYEIGRTDFRCPAERRRRGDRFGAGARARRLPAARLLRLRPRRPDARRGQRRAAGARGQRDPRPHRDLAAAAGRRGGRDLLRRADRARAGPRAGARTPA